MTSPREIERKQAHAPTGGSVVLAASIVAALCASAPAFSAQIETEEGWQRFVDNLNPYASLGYAYDSNIFRYDDKVQFDGKRSDQFATLTAGFDMDLQVSQQRYELAAEIGHTFFDNYSDLDYTGGKAAAIWHWSAAETGSGTAGYKFSRTLRDFANQQTLERVKDVRTEHQLLASGDFNVASNWRMGLRGNLSDISFSNTKSLNLKRTTAGTDFMYVSSADNLVGLDLNYIRGKYDNNPTADFDEYTIGPKIEWRLSGKTTMKGTVGYTSRNHDSPLRQDFQGVTGRVSMTVENEERNRITATVYRDLSNLGDEIAEYAAVTGVKIEPNWQFANGLDLRISAGYENRDFKSPGSSTVPDIIGKREDDVYTGGAWVDWNVRRNIKLSAGVDMQQRSSSRALQDYDFARFQILVTGSI